MRIFFIGIIALFNIVCSTKIYSQKLNDYQLFQLQVLKGVNEFGVYVWDIEGYHKDSTLTPGDIEKFITKALKAVKIKTVSFSEARKLDGQPTLEAQIKVDQKKNEDSYAYSVNLRFVQDIRLERNKQPQYGGIVWERDELAHADLTHLNLEIKIALNSLLDDFIKDYQIVNK
ncbi:MAG: hypothetical protein CVV23_07900 [Ignavibacteriae bacterium HGW-Ignavibacteriae-2]|nr:MAG: hypothetical protein CVV23_07900 [Ignavibacteriae bacterium HGW-Ignavibacteriae-2]